MLTKTDVVFVDILTIATVFVIAATILVLIPLTILFIDFVIIEKIKQYKTRRENGVIWPTTAHTLFKRKRKSKRKNDEA